MMQFWKQRVELIAGSKQFTNDKFEIDFNIEFGDSDNPDMSEVYIYNLSNETIASIKSKAGVILNAGYDGDVGEILNGKIEKIETYWEGVDKVTKIIVGDGSTEWQIKKANKTYQAGSTSKYIINDLANQLGLEIGEINLVKDVTYKKGRTIATQLQQALRSVVKDTGSRMFIDKGKLYIRPPTKGTKTGFLLSADTGLIESPQIIEEEDEKGNKVVKYNVRCLLNHRITTDSIIQVKSKTINGNYKVKKGKYYGDFIMEFEAVSI